MNHSLLMWLSLAAFGALSGARAATTLRAAPGLPVTELAALLAALIVLGGSLVALREPARYGPDDPRLAYLAAAGTVVYAASLVV